METDLAIAPFQLVSAEQAYLRRLEISAGGHRLALRMGGKIDRVDKAGDSLRVIDYKTGHTRQNFPDLKALFEGANTQRNGAAMQTLLYAWLVKGEHQRETILPGLYVMRSLYSESFDPALTIGKHSQKERIQSFSEHEEEFIAELSEVLSGLFDPEVPFTQRENDVKCSYCDFALICNRASFEN